MKRILVGVDGSPQSERAVSVAAELAKPFDAEVTVLAVSERFVPPPDLFALTAEVERGWQEQAKRVAEAQAAAVRAKGGRASARTVVGLPASALAEAAEEGDFDLVVVGSRGLGGVARLLMGSTSDRLVHHCQRNVLVVR